MCFLLTTSKNQGYAFSKSEINFHIYDQQFCGLKSKIILLYSTIHFIFREYYPRSLEYKLIIVYDLILATLDLNNIYIMLQFDLYCA